jgi:hypothetical protein
VLEDWLRLWRMYTEDLNYRRYLSIPERKIIVVKLEADVACLDWALKVYLSTEIRSREIGRDPELNVRIAKPTDRGDSGHQRLWKIPEMVEISGGGAKSSAEMSHSDDGHQRAHPFS